MLEELLHFIVTTVKQSYCVPLLQNGLLILWKMVVIGQEEVCSRLKRYEGLPEALKSIAACAAYSNRGVRMIAALIAQEMNQLALPVELFPDTDSDLFTEEQILELCEVLADRNPTIKCRVERLAAASRSPVAKRTSVPRRKCSNPACKKFEPKAERFKTCRGCLLEIYCSAGERSDCVTSDSDTRFYISAIALSLMYPFLLYPNLVVSSPR